MSLTKNNLTNEERAEIFAQAFETPEGKVALAQGMVEPIRRSLEYQAVGRKCLLIDELAQGQTPRYERDVAAVATTISKRGAVPHQIVEGEEILVPTFEIAAFPSVRMSEIQARRFYIVDRAQIKAKEAIQKEEDSYIFSACIGAANNLGTQVVTNVGDLTVQSLNTAMKLVEQHDLVASKIVMHSNQYASVRLFGKDFFDEATQREVITTGLYGRFFTCDIHVSSRMDRNGVLVLSSPDTVGVFAIRQDISVLPADDPKRLRIGWVIYEEVGILVANDYSIGFVTVTAST